MNVRRLQHPSMRWRLLLAVPFALYGCTSAVKQVATVQVARDFYRARYDEACHAVKPPAWCVGFDVALNKTDRDLAEATTATTWVQKSGAKMPLQLKAIKTDQKTLAAGYKP